MVQSTNETEETIETDQETEETQDQDQEQDENPLMISDEDFAKVLEESEAAAAAESEETDATEETEESEESEETKESEEETDTSKETEESDESEDDESEDTETDEEESDETEESDTKKEDESDEEDSAAADTTDTVDFKAEYEKIMAPFKANGTEMRVQSADDVRQLMQMGANYHKKMAALKPNLKIMKLLENNNLIQPDKINFLIDLHNKEPKAITQLLKDSNMDPQDIDMAEETGYKPTSREISDQEIAIDQVLDEIQDTPSYKRTLGIITKEWDQTSRTAFSTTPSLIQVLNEQVENGIFDQVMGQVTYQRSLGNLIGVSDFDAYKQMGDALATAGTLKIPGVPTNPNTPEKPTETKTTKAREIKRQKRKKAAGPTKTTKTPAAQTFNPFDLSDEEFEKMNSVHFRVKG